MDSEYPKTCVLCGKKDYTVNERASLEWENEPICDECWLKPDDADINKCIKRGGAMNNAFHKAEGGE